MGIPITNDLSTDIVTIVVKSGDGIPAVFESSTSSAAATAATSTASSSSSSSATSTLAIASRAARLQDGKTGTVLIPRSWLVLLPWFEAKLERWQKEGEHPQILLQIPDGCNAIQGARLLRVRLWVHFSHTPSICGRDIAKEGPLNEALMPLGWWRESAGSLRALTAVLHVFHMTMLDKFALEVADTLSKFRVPCPRSVVIIAADLRKDVAEDFSSHASITVSLPRLEEMLDDACCLELRQNAAKVTEREIEERVAGLQLWATRAILGSSFASTSDVIEMLVDALFECFVLDLPDQRIRQTANPTAPEAVIGREKPRSASKWLGKRLEDLVSQKPYRFTAILEEVKARLPMKQDPLKVLYVDADNEVVEQTSIPVKVDFTFPISICETLRNCMNVLFVQSESHPELTGTIESVFRKCVSLLYPLQFFRGASGGGGPVYRFPQLTCDVFAVSPAPVQIALLEELPPQFYRMLQTKVRHVHEEARHLFAGKASYLATTDITFLSTAHFPQPLGEEHWPTEAAETQSAPETRCRQSYDSWMPGLGSDRVTPAAKKARK
mmetsp:Transcript_52062/g.110706  ORF Transcript_52062/g.110706 Transcript_52062/m.110706 type:complete len:555 (-) Transcript_52062:179-1843(-)